MLLIDCARNRPQLHNFSIKTKKNQINKLLSLNTYHCLCIQKRLTYQSQHQIPKTNSVRFSLSVPQIKNQIQNTNHPVADALVRIIFEYTYTAHCSLTHTQNHSLIHTLTIYRHRVKQTHNKHTLSFRSFVYSIRSLSYQLLYLPLWMYILWTFIVYILYIFYYKYQPYQSLCHFFRCCFFH